MRQYFNDYKAGLSSNNTTTDNKVRTNRNKPPVIPATGIHIGGNIARGKGVRSYKGGDCPYLPKNINYDGKDFTISRNNDNIIIEVESGGKKISLPINKLNGEFSYSNDNFIKLSEGFYITNSLLDVILEQFKNDNNKIGLEKLTLKQLKEKAKERNIKGRSTMNKDAIIKALRNK